MTTKAIDLLCAGGLSLLAIAAVIAFAPRPLQGNDYGLLFALGVLINSPHFIASYRILYGSRESVLRYKAASIYFPAAIFAYSVFAIAFASRQPIHGKLILAAAGLYLSRHYTGQAWGMMSTFSFLEGTPFAERERRLVRLSLNLLMGWHLAWAASRTVGFVAPEAADVVRRIYVAACWLAPVASGIGLVGLGLLARRIGRAPPLRVLAPWLAIHVWYVAMAIEPTVLLAVQLGHALQYLPFPMRIGINRRHREEPGAPAADDWGRAALSLVAWIAIGAAVFEGMKPLFAIGFALAGGQGTLPDAVSQTFVAAIGIHHYFVDGALYKLRNPEVRRDLFAHVAPAAAVAPSVAAAAGG